MVFFKKDVFDLASPRLQRLREKVAMFSFDVRWVPGKTHLIADALSRAPLFSAEDLPGLEIDTAISCLSQTSQPFIRLVYNAIDDDYRQLVQDVINNSTSSRYSQHLKGSFDSLSVMDHLVLLVHAESCYLYQLLNPVSYTHLTLPTTPYV